MLTAAHCVSQSGSLLAPNELQVCTRGNRHVVQGESTCTHVLSIQVNNNWLVNEDPEWDLAILEVVADLESYVGKMYLSDADDWTVENALLNQTGYPIADPGCFTKNIRFWGDDDWSLNGVEMYRQFGMAFDARPDVVKTRMDTGSGQSGGALYKCPDFNCEPHENPWLVAVWSGYFEPDGSPFWSGGPSIPGHRTWILNHL